MKPLTITKRGARLYFDPDTSSIRMDRGGAGFWMELDDKEKAALAIMLVLKTSAKRKEMLKDKRAPA